MVLLSTKHCFSLDKHQSAYIFDKYLGESSKRNKINSEITLKYEISLPEQELEF
jgi:hypothetical protein